MHRDNVDSASKKNVILLPKKSWRSLMTQQFKMIPNPKHPGAREIKKRKPPLLQIKMLASKRRH